jgi:3-mercaptopyruvate sulfurtransferase SseA
MLIAGVLLIAGAVISGVLLSRNTAPASGAGAGVQVSQDEIPRVSVDEAKSAFDAGEAVFVDVRAAETYELDHIPGAISIPLNEVEARLGELDQDAWIITYCT